MSSKKSGNKTVPTDSAVESFINAVENERRRRECWDMVGLMEKITGHPATMWGKSLVGFGQYHYTYDSGREGDMFLTGFSPRKTAFTIYVMPGFEKYQELMARLGPHTTGKSCLYIKKMEKVDQDVLKDILTDSVAVMRERYPSN